MRRDILKTFALARLASRGSRWWYSLFWLYYVLGTLGDELEGSLSENTTISNSEGRVVVPVDLRPPPEFRQQQRLLLSLLGGFLEPLAIRKARWEKHYKDLQDEVGNNGPAWNFDWETRWAKRLEPLKRRVGLATLAGIMLLAPSMTANAAGPYFASPGGNDANDGLSTGTAVQTIDRAVTLASAANSIIELMTGNFAFVNTSLVRSGLTIRNYTTNVVTITRTHTGTSWAGNAATVMQFTGACTNSKIMRNPLGGSLTIRHTGTPSPIGSSDPKFLAVGNAHLSFSGIRVSSGSGWTFTDLIIKDIFGYGMNINNSANATVLRCTVSGTASGLWTGSNNTTIQDSEFADNQYMLRDGTVEEDTGANGIQLGSNCTNWTVVNCDIHGNWSQFGCQQFGAEGGAIESFNIPDGGGGAIVGNRCWDNHNWLESGTNDATHTSNGGGPNSEVAYNLVYGKNDYQNLTSGVTQPAGGTSAGPKNAGTAFFFTRSYRDTWIHHNTWDVDDGGAGDAGIRTATGGNFGGGPDSFATNVVENNIFRMRFSTPAFNFNGTGVPKGTTANGNPRAWVIRNNHVFYAFTAATTQVVVASNIVAERITLNQGPSVAVSTHGFCQNDSWGSNNINPGANPLFINATAAVLANRNYHLQSGSTCRNSATDGTDRGALPFNLIGPSVSANATQAFGTGTAFSPSGQALKSRLTIRMG